MKFQGHAVGGALGSMALLGSLYLGGAFHFSSPLFKVEQKMILFSSEIKQAFLLFCLSFFMSLFPDLDTDSIIKRWYYRVLLVFCFFLIYLEENHIALILLLVSILPLLDKHRGWTHSKFAPLFTAILFPLLFNLIQLNTYKNWEAVVELYQVDAMNQFYYSLFIFFGHSLHLVFDSKLFRSTAKK